MEGWAELVTPSEVGGTGIFTDQSGRSGRKRLYRSTRREERNCSSRSTKHRVAVVFATGIALANTGTSAANVTAAFVDDAGNKIPTATTQIAIPAGAHTAFVYDGHVSGD